MKIYTKHEVSNASNLVLQTFLAALPNLATWGELDVFTVIYYNTSGERFVVQLKQVNPHEALGMFELITPIQINAARTIASAINFDIEKFCNDEFRCMPDSLTMTAGASLINVLSVAGFLCSVTKPHSIEDIYVAMNLGNSDAMKTATEIRNAVESLKARNCIEVHFTDEPQANAYTWKGTLTLPTHQNCGGEIMEHNGRRLCLKCSQFLPDE